MCLFILACIAHFVLFYLQIVLVHLLHQTLYVNFVLLSVVYRSLLLSVQVLMWLDHMLEVSTPLVHRTGRRDLMIISMFETIAWVIVLAGIFRHTAATGRKISYHESGHFRFNFNRHAYVAASNSRSFLFRKIKA